VSNDDRTLPVTKKETGAVELHGHGLQAGNLLGGSLSNLSKEQAQAISVKAAEEGLRLEARRAQQAIDYGSAKKVVEDHIDVFNTLDRSGRTTRQTVTTEVNTGAGKMRIESKAGATCFVATAAYNDADHPDVVFLRRFRDEILAKRLDGRLFIAAYWKVGPVLAIPVRRYTPLGRLARRWLSKAVRLVRAKAWVEDRGL
jgi:hypothetical protein